MGRTSDAQQRLVGAAHDLMADRGYGRVGVAEICKLAGVQKGSFYHFYDSKQALTLSVIDAHWSAQRAQWQALLAGGRPALERLRLLLLAQAQGQRAALVDTGALHGCLLGNLALELSGQEKAVAERLVEVFDEQIEMVHVTLQQAVSAGELSADTVAHGAAAAVVAHLEGLVLFAKLRNDPAVLDSLWRGVSQLLGIEHSEAAVP